MIKRGFLLTRQVIDTRQGLVIVLWVKSGDTLYKLEVAGEKAVFFVTQQAMANAKNLLRSEAISHQQRELPLKDFKQQPITACYFDSLRDFYRARDALKSNSIKCYEDDIRPDDRYLMERFITASLDFTGDFKQKNGFVQVANARCKAAPFEFYQQIKLSMLSVDIECSMQSELYSIGCYSDHQDLAIKTVFMIGDESHANPPLTGDKLDIFWVQDELELVKKFIAFVSQVDPDILIGWNFVGFDLRVLEQASQRLGVSFNLGRDYSKVHWRENKNTEQLFATIAGRVVLDGIDLLKTATYNFPSFSLENVAQALLGEGKAIDDVDNRAQEITRKFHHNKAALALYNLEDCRLVTDIFGHTDLLNFAKLRSSLTGLELDRIGGSVAAFTNLYLPKLHRAGYIAPNLGDGLKGLVSPGGFVMDSKPGLYQHVLVLDFKSLYPSIIRTFNIDPMGMVEGLLDTKNSIEGFDGAYFSRDKHFLPDIIQNLWQQRDIAKRDKNAVLSQAIKIIMNSFYGVLGSNGCRFFDPRLSGSITKRSHQILQTTKEWVEESHGHTVIYGDTDSIFVHVKSAHSDSDAQRVGKELELWLNDKWHKHLKTAFNVESELEIEFETHFHQFLMPTVRGMDIGTKKRYAGLTGRDEHEKLIFKGLESVRTDWTQIAKDFQQTLYLKVFHGEPVKQYIIDTVEKLKSGNFDKQLVYRKRLRRKLQDYQKNVPPHVKAARIADEENKKLGKPLRYQNRGWISYLITVNGPEPIEYQHSLIDYDFYISRQLEAVADGILPFIGLSFAQITERQMGLFD